MSSVDPGSRCLPAPIHCLDLLEPDVKYEFCKAARQHVVNAAMLDIILLMQKGTSFIPRE